MPKDNSLSRLAHDDIKYALAITPIIECEELVGTLSEQRCHLSTLLQKIADSSHDLALITTNGAETLVVIVEIILLIRMLPVKEIIEVIVQNRFSHICKIEGDARVISYEQSTLAKRTIVVGRRLADLNNIISMEARSLLFVIRMHVKLTCIASIAHHRQEALIVNQRVVGTAIVALLEIWN